MTAREKLRRALGHESGPVPVDFGSTAVTGMHVTCVQALREHYGLACRPVKVVEPYQMLGLIEEDLLAAIGVDTAGVLPRNTLFGFPNEAWKTWRAPWGQELLVPGQWQTLRRRPDTFIHPAGDTGVPASGHMPEGSFFFDTIIRQEPIDETSLDPNDNLEEFGPIAAADLSHFKDEAVRAAATGRAVVATFGGTGFGDIALVPGPFMKQPKGIRDVAEWYMSTVIRRDYVQAVFEKQLEYALHNLASTYAVVGNLVDVVFLCGTDFGTQTSSFCSPDSYEQLWHPCYKALNDWIHEKTNWKTFKHSCGAVEPFMERFIRSGFDVINPVQCSAAGMDPRTLKHRYGDRLVFWGGGVDTQHTLPFGTPEQVRTEVLERCELFSGDGGFVFDAIHNVQANTPLENVVAMIDAVKEFNALA